jgi:hypothetical protein
VALRGKMEDNDRVYVLRQQSVIGGIISVPSASLPDELIRRLSIYDPVSATGFLCCSSALGQQI